jgi:hypothetical protein
MNSNGKGNRRSFGFDVRECGNIFAQDDTVSELGGESKQGQMQRQEQGQKQTPAG